MNALDDTLIGDDTGWAVATFAGSMN